jgi:ATP-dependent DNA ligase
VTPPLPATLAPMEAESVAALPEGDAWQYEPKWDGFRCLAFRDGDDVLLQSKSGQPLARYFPDVVAALRALGAPRFVFDGEIVVPVDGMLSFDDLLQRIHPAASRVQLLAAQTPAVFIAFDLLADESGRPRRAGCSTCWPRCSRRSPVALPRRPSPPRHVNQPLNPVVYPATYR